MAEQHNECQEEIGQNTSRDHQSPLMERAVEQQIRIIIRNVAVFIVVGEGHEATEGKCPDGVGHTPALPFDQGRSEADRKAADSDPLQCGGQKMACLMNNDQQGQNGKGREHIHFAFTRAIGSFWLELFTADVGDEGFRQPDASIGLLAVFQQGRHGASHS